MSDSSENAHIIADQNFSLGNLRVDPSRNVFHNDSDAFHLEPRIMRVLCMLAGHSGDVVTRDKLIETIWNVEYGADESLTRAISILRKTFREAGEPDGHIETIPKSGYRLASSISLDVEAILQPAPSESVPQIDPVPANTAPQSPSALNLKPRFLIIGGLIAAIVLVFGGIKLFDDPIGAELATGKGRSVAILSFTDMSAKKDQEYFSDGITEEIFLALSDIPNLKIAARNSAFAYKGKPTDMRAIGDDLNVSHIIDGSVRTQGERVRITAQLIDTADGLHVWTKSYDGLLSDMFGLQERVSRDIVVELRLVLTIGLQDVVPIELNALPAPPSLSTD